MTVGIHCVTKRSEARHEMKSVEPEADGLTAFAGGDYARNMGLKVDALARLRAGDHSLPAGRISTANALAIAGEAAAGGAAR